ncbi:putative lipoprotein [Bacteriovorax sp. BAL6_X]|uniref:hypothetical protein n=1 Tax=Bacteriovorax sp. BAL6_X TaxID=1201290 RepID=UPI00038667DC|nr:hypothetical protein [Bacteriovorax sp. BAL6_X]EPZ49553.1 putative lipoprotein [Bacteriovorax sp. BAL6_X]
MKVINMLLILFTIILTSCGGKSSSVKVKLQGAFSQVAGLFDNGAVMLAVGGPSDRPPLLHVVPLSQASLDHEFDNGVWKIMVLGWHGSSAGEMMKGDLYCSVVKNASIPEQTTFNFNLTKVDGVAPANVVDTGHPCAEFIDGLQTAKYMSICETTNCNMGEYVRFNATDLSLKFGIPHYEGPINRNQIHTQSKFTEAMNTCYSSTNGNLVDGSDYAKMVLDSSIGLVLPIRLKGGFYLPLRIEGYEDSNGGTTNCSSGLNGKLTTMNSIGEKDASGNDRHFYDGTYFKYIMPPTPFEISLSGSTYSFERNTSLTVQVGGPYDVDNDSYKGSSINYTCEYKVAGTDDTSLVACSYPVGSDPISYDESTGDVLLDGSSSNFNIDDTFEFKLTASYFDSSLGTDVTSPEKRFTVTAQEIVTASHSDLTPAPNTNINISTYGYADIYVTNNTDNTLHFIISSSPDSLTLGGDTSCSIGTTCSIRVSGTPTQSGNLTLSTNTGQEFIYMYD